MSSDDREYCVCGESREEHFVVKVGRANSWGDRDTDYQKKL